MRKKKKELPVYKKVAITAMSSEGKAIAKVDDMIIFVRDAVPGDLSDIQIIKKKRNYLEGKAIHFHNYSDKRISAFCDHFGTCGGCKWQNIQYEEQLKYKQEQVTSNFKKIAKVNINNIEPILPSEEIMYYRNKLEFSFSNKRWLTQDEIALQKELENLNALGFHIPGRYDKILDIKRCYLQAEPANEIRLAVREYALKNDLSFFNLKNQEGLLRTLITRNTSSGDFMVIIVFFYNDPEKIKALLNHIEKKFPGISSLLYVINSKGNDTIHDLKIFTFKGKDFIYEDIEGLRFKIGPKSFFQTNVKQAVKLYKTTRDFAILSGNEIIYDLYTGTGTIANFIAKKAKKVIGIDNIPEAIEDAKENSKINQITNTEFYSGDIKDIIDVNFIKRSGQPDIIITDPPRAGMHSKAIKSILHACPKRIVYVSCNPATQARDIHLLSEKYKLIKSQPIDMFPHTPHVENIVLMERL